MVRTLVSDFPKSADVMPDELRYLDLSRSLVTDGTLTIRGVASSFQKILYPIALIPAMLFPDPQTQVHVIAFLNSLYASSVVFPAYVLAKRLVFRLRVASRGLLGSAAFAAGSLLFHDVP